MDKWLKIVTFQPNATAIIYTLAKNISIIRATLSIWKVTSVLTFYRHLGDKHNNTMTQFLLDTCREHILQCAVDFFFLYVCCHTICVDDFFSSPLNLTKKLHPIYREPIGLVQFPFFTVVRPRLKAYSKGNS